MSGASWFDPIRLSLLVSAAAGAIAFVLAALAAWRMARASFRGKTVVETAFLLPLVLPPTVIGFLLLVAFGRRSAIGQAYEWLFQQPIVFTATAAVIASTVVAFPLAYQTIKAGFEAVDKDLTDAGRSIGATEWQLLRFIVAPLAARAMIAGFILGFARALGEFGATLMFAGSIPGRTQTLPTAIYFAAESGNESWAWAWCATIVAISFAMLLFIRAVQRKAVE